MGTADVSYVPGALTAVTGDQCWALVETSPDSPAVTTAWRRLGQGAGADALLTGLLAEGLGGDGLGSTGGFALLVAGADGQHRLFCRGTVGATIVRGPADGGAAPGEGRPTEVRAAEVRAGAERIDGAGLLTWREQVVGNAKRIFLGEPPVGTALRLPATSGVRLAGCVIIDLTAFAEPETASYLPDNSFSDTSFSDTVTMPQKDGPVGRASAAPPVVGKRLPDDRGPLASPAPPPPTARTIPPDRIGPVVPALLCPSGHVNPPSGAICRRCGAPLPHEPVPVPRPVLGLLRLSFGDVITLDRGVLMGRNPRAEFAGPDGFGSVGSGERPHVVKLPCADGDISRTHLRVTLDGWHVLVTDLNSTNGTLVTLPGRDPLQLRPGEPLPIQPGTVVTLAEGTEFRYELT